MKTKNYNHYNLNPPTPAILPPQNPTEYFEELIAEHNFELNYEESEIESFDLMERQILKELIKNEPKCII